MSRLRGLLQELDEIHMEIEGQLDIHEEQGDDWMRCLNMGETIARLKGIAAEFEEEIN